MKEISQPPIGFKEWAIICEALGTGQQSLIIRKGGIAEGRDGFRFKHPAFFLFPTLFHEQIAKTRLPASTPLPATEEGVTIRLYAEVEWTRFVDDWERVVALEPFHLWNREAIRERFEYDDERGVHVAALRIYRLAEPWQFPDHRSYGGCRSWLNLPALPEEATLSPVLDAAGHAERLSALTAMLGA